MRFDSVIGARQLDRAAVHFFADLLDPVHQDLADALASVFAADGKKGQEQHGIVPQIVHFLFVQSASANLAVFILGYDDIVRVVDVMRFKRFSIDIRTKRIVQ